MREQIFANQKRLGVIPREHQAHALARRPAEVGHARRRREEAVRAPGRGLRRLRRLHRPRDRPGDPGGRGPGQARQHADHLHRGRQRHERRGLDHRHAVRPGRDPGHRHAGRRPAEVLRRLGLGRRPTPHMSVAWSWAFDTPFKWTKQIASHFGGTRQGMAISWPGRIKDAGGIRSQFHHVIDIVPTILEATGIAAPADGQRHRAEADRRRQHGLHLATRPTPTRRRRARRSTSRCSATARSTTTAGSPRPRRRRAPWLMGLGQAARRDQWLQLGALQPRPRTSRRPTTSRPRMPDKLRELQELFLVEAAKYQVFPLDNSVAARALAPRPSATAGRDDVHLHGRAVRPAGQRRAEHRSTGPTPSPPRSRCRRAAARACSSPRAAASAATASTCSRASRCSPTTCSASSASAGKASRRSRPASTPSCSTSPTTDPASARAAPAC